MIGTLAEITSSRAIPGSDRERIKMRSRMRSFQGYGRRQWPRGEDLLFHGEPMEVMARILEAQSALCDQLEAVADSLPNVMDSEACFRLAAVMKVLVTKAHRFKEAVVYPLFEARFADRVEMPAIIARLRSEHAEDETYALELAEALIAAGRGNTVRNPEAMGYMLRAFFLGLRRQVAFEREQLGAYVALQ